jgi:hypothetical protein
MRFLHMATRLASTHQGRLVCGARRSADGIVNLMQKIARMCSKERTIYNLIMVNPRLCRGTPKV